MIFEILFYHNIFFSYFQYYCQLWCKHHIHRLLVIPLVLTHLIPGTSQITKRAHSSFWVPPLFISTHVLAVLSQFDPRNNIWFIIFLLFLCNSVFILFHFQNLSRWMCVAKTKIISSQTTIFNSTMIIKIKMKISFSWGKWTFSFVTNTQNKVPLLRKVRWLWRRIVF
jgi:hypothetical protein